MGRLARFLALEADERRALLAAIGALAATRLLMWLLPHRAAMVRVQAAAARPRVAPQSSGDAARIAIARAVTRAARVVPRATCLVQALAGDWLCARARVPVALEFGVSRGPRGIEAHAWLVSGDRIILGGAEAARFVVLARGPQG